MKSSWSFLHLSWIVGCQNMISSAIIVQHYPQDAPPFASLIFLHQACDESIYFFLFHITLKFFWNLIRQHLQWGKLESKSIELLYLQEIFFKSIGSDMLQKWSKDIWVNISPLYLLSRVTHHLWAIYGQLVLFHSF